jgi:hypothetical protein
MERAFLVNFFNNQNDSIISSIPPKQLRFLLPGRKSSMG